MIKPKDHFHGSDLEAIENAYHIKKEDLISFSANINPLGISYQLRSTLAENLDAIMTYPDRNYTQLRSCMASYVKTVPEHIILGNGSTELISLFIQICHPKKALVLGPTYSEYEREISLGGGTTLYYPLREEEDFQMNVKDFCQNLSQEIDLVVLCNPNNPTSTAITQDKMRHILDVCQKNSIFVMVDETYVEFAPDEAEITSIPLTKEYDNLIILRGTSKFFAAPGLRLGYAVTGNLQLLETIHTKQNPWSIHSLAEVAGRLMFSDQEYIKHTKSLICTQRDRMYQELSSWDSVKVYPACANFILVRILREDITSHDVFEHCIRRGLVIRDCSTFPYLDSNYFRFCIMSEEDNTRLLHALREILC